MRILPEDTCCMVVDYQERLMPAIAEKEALIRNSVGLLRGLRILEIPVMVTAQYAKGLGMNIAEIREAAGTEQYFDKLTFSVTGDVSARRHLEKIGRKNVVLCGIEAHICVLQTVVDLAAEGYQPILAADCIGARDPYDKEIAIRRAQHEGAIVTTRESLLFELTGAAGSSRFKQISNLIKEMAGK